MASGDAAGDVARRAGNAVLARQRAEVRESERLAAEQLARDILTWCSPVPEVTPAETAADALRQVQRWIAALRVPPQRREHDLQGAVAHVCLSARATTQREVVLKARCRIDLTVDVPRTTGGPAWVVGIEVKMGKPNSSELAAQAARYLETGALDALLLVVERSASRIDVGRQFGPAWTSRVAVASLSKQWGLSL